MEKARADTKRIVERSFIIDNTLYQTYMTASGDHLGQIEFDLAMENYARYVIYLKDVSHQGEDHGKRTFH